MAALKPSRAKSKAVGPVKKTQANTAMKTSAKSKPTKNAKDRSKVSQKNELKYQARLAEVRKVIDRNNPNDEKTFETFTVPNAKKFGLHNNRYKMAKKDLIGEGYLVQIEGKRSPYSKKAKAVLSA